MGTPSADILSRHLLPLHRLTRDEYYRMAEAGILMPGARVELLEGQVVDMSPSGPRHALVTETLTELLVPACVGRAGVRCQLPITLDDCSEPEPDFALVRRPWTGYPNTHPGPADVFLLIEVSDSSLDLDRRVKLPLYARAGIREVWIVDLTADVVHVHRDPSGLEYGTVRRVVPPARLGVEALPGVAVPAEALFL